MPTGGACARLRPSGFPISYTLHLFHRDPVGTRRAGSKGRVEVEIKPRVLGESIMRDFEDVDFVVAFKVNDARVVLVEEVVLSPGT